MREHGMRFDRCANVVSAGDVVNFKSMSAEFIHVSHSISDSWLWPSPHRQGS